MSFSAEVCGFESHSGTKWIRVSKDKNVAYLELQRFVGRGDNFSNALAEKGVCLFGPEEIKKTRNNVSFIDEFPIANFIENIGWNEGCFALPDGTVFEPTDGEYVSCTIEFKPHKCQTKGTLKGWKKQVAQKLEKQQLPIFSLCFAFMPPLLAMVDRDLNIGFEIVGAPGIGKSTIQQLAASAIGGSTRNTGHPYGISMDTTVNALEATMRDHQDMPILMDEANLFLGESSKSKRADAFQAIAFKLGSGSIKDRYDAPAAGRHFRLGYLISSNDPLSEMICSDSDAAKAAQDRLITIPIAPERLHGVFDYIPPETTGSEFATSLVRAAQRHYGHAIRRFLEKLVPARSENERELRKQIDGYMIQFRSKAGVDANDGSAVRVADAFGLVYAAGRLAQEYGALPKNLTCGPAALYCYQLHLAHTKPPPPISSRLRSIIERTDVVKLSKNLKNRELTKASVLINHKEKFDEVLIRARAIHEEFPDWDAICKSDDVRFLLKRDSDHHDRVKRNVGPKRKAERVYCFRVIRS